MRLSRERKPLPVTAPVTPLDEVNAVRDRSAALGDSASLEMEAWVPHDGAPILPPVLKDAATGQRNAAEPSAYRQSLLSAMSLGVPHSDRQIIVPRQILDVRQAHAAAAALQELRGSPVRDSIRRRRRGIARSVARATEASC